MVISDVEYHIILEFCIEDLFKPKMKNDLQIIIPDLLIEYSGTVKKLTITPERLHLYISASANFSPKFIAEDIVTKASSRLVRIHRDLQGYDKIFKDNIYVKTGTKPDKKRVDDVFFIANAGI